MEEKEFIKKVEEYKTEIKKKTDRELIENMAIKLKIIELKIEELSEDRYLTSK